MRPDGKVHLAEPVLYAHVGNQAIWAPRCNVCGFFTRIGSTKEIATKQADAHNAAHGRGARERAVLDQVMARQDEISVDLSKQFWTKSPSPLAQEYPTQDTSEYHQWRADLPA